MKTLILLIIFSLSFIVPVSGAVESRTIASANGQAITNIDVFEEIPKTSIVDEYCGPHCMQRFLEKIIEPILFEQYASKYHILDTDQDVIDEFKQSVQKAGYLSVNAYFQTRKGEYEGDIKNWDDYKTFRNILLKRKVIEHFSPDVLIATEEDIEAYIEYYKKRYSFPMGNPESIQFRGISIQTEAFLGELEDIRQQINENVQFETIANDYRNRKEFLVFEHSASMQTRTLERERIEKQGDDASVPWKNLEGKAVIVSFREAGHAVWVIDKYTPDTRMEIEDAVNSGVFREQVIEDAKGLKYQKAMRRFLEKQKTAALAMIDNKEELYQTMADQYELWWFETYEKTPGFQERLEIHKNSKTKYLLRQKKENK